MTHAQQKIDPLTSTRFFAALSVVLYHGGRELGILNYLQMFTSGPTAVGYFFVLSGFIITFAYYRPEIRFDFRSYWLARFSRIYPVYILSFVLTCLFYIEIISRIKPGKVWANVFLYQAWFPRYASSFNIVAWSLSVEVFFYLLFPFIAMCVRRLPVKTVLWISLAFWAVSQFVHSILYIRYMPQEANWLLFFPLFHLNSFLLGMAGGIWYLTRAGKQGVNQSSNRGMLLASLGLVFLTITLREYAPSFPQNFSLDAGLLAPLFLLIILALALDTTRLSQRLAHPWLVLLGDSSYALFILHIPFLWLFRRLLEITGISISYSSMFFIHVFNSIVLSIMVFKFMERPARDWLRKNSRALPYIFVDVMLVLIMVHLSFLLRLGDEFSQYPRTQTFTVRIGVTAYFFFLLVFRYYTRNTPRALAFAVLSGTVTLTGFLYVAWTAGWVEIFPKSIIALIALLVYASIHLSRALSSFMKGRLAGEPGMSS
jgi:peptidoglycan/LPS O-acetylase OafA/YrhL